MTQALITITKNMLRKISPVLWELPLGTVAGMRVPACVYVSKNMLDDLLGDRSLNQLLNVATLPGIVSSAMAMPDAHEGYGFPIGGVAAMRFADGVISPGGIGYDINCGVRMLRTHQTIDEIKPHLADLSREFFHQVPSGVGRGGQLVLTPQELDQVLRTGINFMVDRGYALASDARHIESYGVLDNADPEQVSQTAKKRGYDQLGTLGSGNHFVEVDYVDEIFDE